MMINLDNLQIILEQSSVFFPSKLSLLHYLLHYANFRK